MEFIPGSPMLVAGLAILSVAILMNYAYWPVLLLFLVVWRVVQDYVISPRVMGKSMELHPLAAIFESWRVAKSLACWACICPSP
jgi:predicted PurR-regulated permease PerM